MLDKNIKKFWLTKAECCKKGEPKISIWWKQKPGFNDGPNGKFWWCDCRGKREIVSSKFCKQLFGITVKGHEIYTIEIKDGSFTTVKQTPKDCPVGNSEIRFEMEW